MGTFSVWLFRVLVQWQRCAKNSSMKAPQNNKWSLRNYDMNVHYLSDTVFYDLKYFSTFCRILHFRKLPVITWRFRITWNVKAAVKYLPVKLLYKISFLFPGSNRAQTGHGLREVRENRTAADWLQSLELSWCIQVIPCEVETSSYKWNGNQTQPKVQERRQQYWGKEDQRISDDM